MPMKRNTGSPIQDGQFLHVHSPSTNNFCSASEELTLSNEKLRSAFHGHSISKFDEEGDLGIKSGEE